ncbi:MAG: hypothetical protein IPP91_07745 [Betaproteobacteria bacterium]|nr:hypothetical protein [Betaproteobacteria bacterium]
MFLTNNTTLPALTIAGSQEPLAGRLFFKWIKQHLRIKRFMAPRRTPSRHIWTADPSTCWWPLKKECSRSLALRDSSLGHRIEKCRCNKPLSTMRDS